MRGKLIIFTVQDMRNILANAINQGMSILFAELHTKPEPFFLREKDISSAEPATYHLFYNAWVYGEFIHRQVSDGIHKGKYFTVNVNYSSISASFLNLCYHESKQRLGAGDIGFSKDWLKFPEKELRKAPDEVETVFNSIVKEISSGKKVKGGVNTYVICKDAYRCAKENDALPPYDYIKFNF